MRGSSRESSRFSLIRGGVGGGPALVSSALNRRAGSLAIFDKVGEVSRSKSVVEGSGTVWLRSDSCSAHGRGESGSRIVRVWRLSGFRSASGIPSAGRAGRDGGSFFWLGS